MDNRKLENKAYNICFGLGQEFIQTARERVYTVDNPDIAHQIEVDVYDESDAPGESTESDALHANASSS